VPTAVTGRVLKAEQTGDYSDWIELAQNGDYSLIVRRYPISFGNLSYGATSNYQKSNVRDSINRWFNNVSRPGSDNLPHDARLRDYTVISNAYHVLGSSCQYYSLLDGYSKPTSHKAWIGDDVAFALSYGESANFLSIMHFQRGVNIANVNSNWHAVSNYKKVFIPSGYLMGMWLRSPGDCNGTAAFLGNADSEHVPGRTFQSFLNDSVCRGLAYPALWVDQGIFGPVVTTGSVNVYHVDAATGAEIYPRENYQVNAGYYGPYVPKNIGGYQTGRTAPYSDAASGFISAGEVKNITYLYDAVKTSSATIIVMHISTSGQMLKGAVYTVASGIYGGTGLYGAESFDGYIYLNSDPGSAPLMGFIKPDEIIFITHRYARAS